jgi:hypothetical protein
MIIKCHGVECPLRETCVRYTAKAKTSTPFYEHTPFYDGDCDLYVPKVENYLSKKKGREREEDRCESE